MNAAVIRSQHDVTVISFLLGIEWLTASAAAASADTRMGSGSWHCSVRGRNSGAERPCRAYIPVLRIACTQLQDFLRREHINSLLVQGRLHGMTHALCACTFWACFHTVRVSVLLRFVCCADGWSDASGSRLWGFVLSHSASYDDTHVHYGPGGTSNASAYGLQNGRVRNMLR